MMEWMKQKPHSLNTFNQFKKPHFRIHDFITLWKIDGNRDNGSTHEGEVMATIWCGHHNSGAFMVVAGEEHTMGMLHRRRNRRLPWLAQAVWRGDTCGPKSDAGLDGVAISRHRAASPEREPQNTRSLSLLVLTSWCPNIYLENCWELWKTVDLNRNVQD